MKLDKRTPFVPFDMSRDMFYKKPKAGDRSKTRKVYMILKGRETLVGYIFLPDPDVMQYAFKAPWMTHPSKERFKTLRAAMTGLGAKL